jgi:hypothetical protein
LRHLYFDTEIVSIPQMLHDMSKQGRVRLGSSWDLFRYG